MKEYSINTLYLTEISELGYLKDFAQWITYKSLLNKGCCYNYTDVHFAKKVGISTSKARVLRLFWIERGWCRFEKGRIGKNLIFNSARNSVRREKWHKTKVRVYKNIEDTINNLYYQVIENKGKNQFEYLKRVSSAISKPFNKSYKWGKKEQKNLKSDKLPKADARFRISYKGLGKLFGCSQGKAHYLMNKFMKDKKVIAIKQTVQEYGTQSGVGLVLMSQTIKNSFVSGKHIYRNECNQYIFN